MTKEQVRQAAAELYESLEGNVLRADMDIDPAYAGIPMYDAPLIGFGAADDPLFAEFRKPEVVGPWHMAPEEWLPEARAVVSFFFPASEAVRRSNRESAGNASVLWSYARIEGQDYINAFMKAVAAWFEGLGVAACVPSSDPRWQQVTAGKGIEGYPGIDTNTFGSRWSERHAAYVCALGTFGLSKGLITERGMAGRFGSVIVSEPFPADPRPYTGVYDYCSCCGACARRCPVGAIDPERGKDHTKCAPFVRASGVLLYPRYGCGLCQTGVPCETCIPAAVRGRTAAVFNER